MAKEKLILSIEDRLQRKMTELERILVSASYDYGHTIGFDNMKKEALKVLHDNPFPKFSQTINYNDFRN